MESEKPQQAFFSYEVLDREAVKISSLVSQVQQVRDSRTQTETALELCRWAEELDAAGCRHEAEFLYLHAVHLWENVFGVQYPFVFQGLRPYALSLKKLAQQQNEPNEPQLLVKLETVTYRESNAA